ncbi:MAG: TonB-dependent receptor, partial [Betaproteobacteria bacterium]
MHGPTRRTAMPVLSLILSRWCSTSLLAATFVFYLSAPDAQVPPKQTTMEPVFVTAARSPQPLAELIADVTTIGPDEIARAGAQSLAELLARVPGVEIAMNGGPGSTSSV